MFPSNSRSYQIIKPWLPHSHNSCFKYILPLQDRWQCDPWHSFEYTLTWCHRLLLQLLQVMPQNLSSGSNSINMPQGIPIVRIHKSGNWRGPVTGPWCPLHLPGYIMLKHCQTSSPYHWCSKCYNPIFASQLDVHLQATLVNIISLSSADIEAGFILMFMDSIGNILSQEVTMIPY
jgi:hypothetical protein